MKRASRESDEQILDMLALNEQGLSHSKIGNVLGVTRERVSVCLRRVEIEMENEQ